MFIPIVLSAVAPRQTTEWSAYDSVDYANLHDPDLPRNPEMDIYNKDHRIEVNLTYKELHTYYKAMRCLVKGKDFLPPDDQKYFDEIGLSKRQLLIESDKTEREQERVALKTTNAKAVHMKHVLTFIDQLGLENEKELKKVLEQECNHYHIGKRSPQ